MHVRLVLQPAAERSRSMVLYAERLVASRPPGADVEIFRLPGGNGRLSGLTAEVLTPRRVLPEIRDGIVHVVDHAHAGYLRYLRVPGLVTVHDLIPLKVIRRRYPAAARPQISSRAGLWFRWNVRALRRARLVVTPSRATADDLRALVGALRVEVVPHGIDNEYFDAPGEPAVRRVSEALGNLAERRIVLQVSNGFFYKNEEGFASAMRILAGRRDDLAWVRLGAPFRPTTAAIPNVPRWHYADASRREMVALYRLAALLLFPSWDEGFGWPPLEAMAAKCPVVSSERGALAETTAPAALLVDPGDPEQIAAQVERVLDDRVLAEDLAARGREHARGYPWALAAERMGALYAETERCG